MLPYRVTDGFKNSVALACTVCAATTEENTTNLLVSFYRLRVAELLTHVNASGGILYSSCVVQCDQKRLALSLILKKSLICMFAKQLYSQPITIEKTILFLSTLNNRPFEYEFQIGLEEKEIMF